MISQLATLCLLVVIQHGAASSPEATMDAFSAWQSKYSVRYSSSDEAQRRFGVWRSNLQLVEAHNAKAARGEQSFRLGMNKFADLTNSEYRALVLRPRKSYRTEDDLRSYRGTVNATLPASVNWVTKGVLPGVKDQGQCGSCWAFSAVAAMEGAYNTHNQQLNQVDPACSSKCGPNNVSCCSFSEQEVADCTLSGKDTCDIGGEPHDGILEVVGRSGKLSTTTQYPYVSGQTKKLTACKPSGGAVSTGITGYTNVTMGSEEALAEASATHGVISVGIDASSFGFQLYESGVYVDTECKNKPSALDHGVSVVGYGTGDPSPPGPTPPPPGPSNCSKNFYKPQCEHETGCFWCEDSHKFGYCLNEPCSSASSQVVGGTKDYWLVRNSWGMDWGMGGYIAMARGNNNMCGIATDAVFAQV